MDPFISRDTMHYTGTDAANNPGRTSLNKLAVRFALIATIFTGLLLWRSPYLFLNPRFWAEEGLLYYNALQTGNSPITLVVNGNYQLILNLSAYAATLASARWAPAATTYFGLLIALGCVLLICKVSIENEWRLSKTALVAAVLALVAQGYEVYLSGTNSQWLCPLSLLLIGMLSLRDKSRLANVCLYTWVTVCAFSGVPSSLMAPVLLLRGIAYRSPRHTCAGIILGVGAIVQIAVIALHPHPDRSFHPTLLLMTAPWLLQTVCSPLATAGWTEHLIALLRLKQSAFLLAMAYVVLLTVAAFALVAGYRGSRYKAPAVALAATWIFVPTIQVFGALGAPDGLISGWNSGRYFFIGVASFILLLGFAANSSSQILRWPASALLILALGAGVYQVNHGSWKSFMLHGPSWRDEVRACGDHRPCPVQAWPGGPGWTFNLYRQ
jgi:hypothetical protein